MVVLRVVEVRARKVEDTPGGPASAGFLVQPDELQAGHAVVPQPICPRAARSQRFDTGSCRSDRKARE